MRLFWFVREVFAEKEVDGVGVEFTIAVFGVTLLFGVISHTADSATSVAGVSLSLLKPL